MDRPPPTMHLAVLVMIGALGVLGIGGLVTTWDGAWFVARLLETGTPTFMHGRLIGWATQAPALLARSLGGDAAAVGTTLGLGMAAVPIVALLACWRICGPDRRNLMVWPLLGIGLASLPGHAMVVWEAGLAVALGWPLLLAAALGTIGQHRLLVACVLVALLVAHPFAVPVLGLAAIGAAGVAVARGRASASPGHPAGHLRAALAIAALGALLALRYALVPSPYEADSIDPERLTSQFRGAVLGRPLVAVVLAWILGAWLLLRPRADRLGLVAVGMGTLILLAVLVPWAADPARWAQALGYRTFVLAAHLPLMVAAIIIAWRPDRRPGTHPARAPDRSLAGPIALGAAVVALVVLGVQARTWDGVRSAMSTRIVDLPAGCLDARRAGIHDTVLEHWGVTALAYLEQAPSPRHMVVVDTTCDALDAVGGVPLKIVDGDVMERLPPDGWFDLRAIEATLPDAAP